MLSWESLEKEAIESGFTNKPCKFGQFINGLEYSAKSYVDNAINNKKVSNMGLWRALTARGMDCSRAVLDRHRNGSCACSKDIK